MPKVVLSGAALGADVEVVDLANLEDAAFETIRQAALDHVDALIARFGEAAVLAW